MFKCSAVRIYKKMKSYIEQTEEINCPMLPLRGAVAFPGIPLSIELERKMSIRAFDEAFREDGTILFLTQKNFLETEPTSEGFYDIGTLCRITQFVKLANGNVRMVAEGLARAEVITLEEPKINDGAWHTRCRAVYISHEMSKSLAAAKSETEEWIRAYSASGTPLSKDLLFELTSISDPGVFADNVAASLLSEYDDKMKILSKTDPLDRLFELLALLQNMTEISKLRKEISVKVKKRVDKNQREYYLGEQLKVIRSELGDDAGDDADIDEYKEKIESSSLSDDGKKRLMKEVEKLRKIPINSAEYGVICNYIDVCVELPWENKTSDRIDLDIAKEILDRDHDGLDKVKERILEYLAVKQLSPELKNQIICLVGPPGTGKTSVARSIAEALNRKYVRVSLGGIRDEADIRGHRKTYIGSMPGRIIDGIRRVGTKNPVMLLDEIDKLTRDSHGDPSSALMEVLDGEQNKEFRDHFVELPFDLSDVMFVATANTLDTIPLPLLDRMEVIELKSYSHSEKLAISKHHLIPKQLKKHGLNSKQLKISQSALSELINAYTSEAGVRNLEREIATLCRRAAKKLVENPEFNCVSVNAKNISSIMGPKKVIPETVSREDEIGVVNGLAYTQTGGTLLKVEAASMPGSGKLELTGSLGDVMKESAHAALTYIRSHSGEWNIPEEFYKEKDLHVHFPEGAVPKDGPSAGVTVVTAIVSELSGKPVKSSVAMTGEVTLRGNVLPIGGLKEKTMAAYKAGVKTVLIPKDNEKDLDEIDKTVRESLKFIPCTKVSDVLKNALLN